MIQLAYPLALAALAAIPVILALHLLRPRRRRVIVSTTALWQAALREREGGQGLRRLLRNLSLLLLIGIAAALGIALADPQWLRQAGADSDLVLVLDTSASMQTRAGSGGTRFDLALAEGGRSIDALPRDGRMLIITSGRHAVLRSGFESDRAALRRVLAELRPGDEAGRPREALALARSLIRSRPHARIHFVTDGAFDADVDPASPQLVVRLVGGPARNVAITRFDLRQEPHVEDRFQVLLTVRNYTAGPVRVPAAASLDERELFRRTLELAAGEAQTLVLPFTGQARGQAVARIEVEDDLQADNRAYAAIGPEEALRVLLVSSGNVFLESVLAALPGVELERQEAPMAAELPRLARRFDAIVFDGVVVPQLPPGNYLLIDTIAPGLPFTAAGEIAQPRIVGSGASALMRDVDLAAVRVEKANRLAIEPGASGLQRLFWSKETPLALTLLDAERKLVYLGFDLAHSSFALQPAFPLFVSQSLDWLRPAVEPLAATHVAAGSAYSISLPAGEAQITVQAPSGRSTTLQAHERTARYAATAEAGIHRYAIGGAPRYFAVSLADARESDVTPRWSPPAPHATADAASGASQGLEPLWPHLLALALALLAVEWWVFTRGRHA